MRGRTYVKHLANISVLGGNFGELDGASTGRIIGNEAKGVKSRGILVVVALAFTFVSEDSESETLWFRAAAMEAGGAREGEEKRMRRRKKKHCGLGGEFCEHNLHHTPSLSSLLYLLQHFKI